MKSSSQTRSRSTRNSAAAGLLHDRIPPHDLNAEQSVLGAMLIEKEAVFKARGIIGPEDYYRDVHRAIHEAICAVTDRGDTADLITVQNELRSQGVLESIGDVTYLTVLTNTVPTAARVEEYAAIVRDKSDKRKVINELSLRITETYEDCRPATEIAAQATSALVRLASGGRSGSSVERMGDTLLRVIDELEEIHKTGKPPGLQTGIKWIDEMTAGLQPSDLIVVAARPSRGKSALLMQMMLGIAKNAKKAVYLVSGEMTKEALARRLLSTYSGIEGHALRMGWLEEPQWAAILQAFRTLQGIDIHWDDAPTLTTDEIRAKAWRMKVEHDICAVGIDYLQILRDARQAGETRTELVTRMSGTLKALARELNVPVILLSQLKRPEGGEYEEPTLAHLRESGAIEQDADVVVFIHNTKESRDKTPRPVTLDMAKQRNGPTGKHYMMFNQTLGLFAESDTIHEESGNQKEVVTSGKSQRNRNGEYED